MTVTVQVADGAHAGGVTDGDRRCLGEGAMAVVDHDRHDVRRRAAAPGVGAGHVRAVVAVEVAHDDARQLGARGVGLDVEAPRLVVHQDHEARAAVDPDDDVPPAVAVQVSQLEVERVDTGDGRCDRAGERSLPIVVDDRHAAAELVVGHHQVGFLVTVHVGGVDERG